MLVNRDKTTAQFFTLSTKPHCPSLFYDSERIQIAQSTRYLGIEVDSKLRWVDHIESAYIEEKDLPLHTTVRRIHLKGGHTHSPLETEILAMVAERYPSEEWIHVYTYDSQKSEACGTGLFFSQSCNSCWQIR
ncbi:hypothetical protein CEXT_351831 [Caerostris extrusa]|uniref:Uncharacterized protein n=1 Tax=Caerostris extrusa TaxID=172846 RepID=A0AAV4RW92_CAEEX|nr:hypothetical protein CEXT_351831 [Caerostris extrusa]